jgi:hypothetical protein
VSNEHQMYRQHKRMRVGTFLTLAVIGPDRRSTFWRKVSGATSHTQPSHPPRPPSATLPRTTPTAREQSAGAGAQPHPPGPAGPLSAPSISPTTPTDVRSGPGRWPTAEQRACGAGRPTTVSRDRRARRAATARPPQSSPHLPLKDLKDFHSKTKLILGVFLNRPVPHLWAASRFGDIRGS